MPTMIDVARTAGVSVATVSNYINHTKPVKKDKATRIAQVIEELGYIPNQSAKVLKTRISKVIGAVLPTLEDSYYAQIFQSFEKRVAQAEYQVDLRLTYDISSLEMQHIQGLLENNVRAMLIASAQPENTAFFMQNLVSRGVPFVQIDREIDGVEVPFIGFDIEKIIHDLARHYRAMGKRRITLFCGSDRFSCERAAVKGLGVDDGFTHIEQIDLNKEAAFRACVLHMKAFHPEVILVTSSLAASGVIECLALLGLRSPMDIEVVRLGQDNWNKLSNLHGVSSSSREAINAGVEAAKSVLRLLKGTETPRHTILCDHYVPPRTTPRLRCARKIHALMLDTLQTSLFEGLLPNFTKETSIEVEIETKEQTQLYNTALRDEGTDVIMYDLPWLSSFAQNHVLADASELLKKTTFRDEIYLPDLFQAFGEFDGRYYGLPFMFAPQLLFYRKDLFESAAIQRSFLKRFDKMLRPPRTWFEFNTVSAFFTQTLNPDSPVPYGTTVAAAYAECLTPEIYVRLRAFGGWLFNKNNEVIFESNATRRAYRNLLELYTTLPEHARTLNDLQTVDEFLDGKLAMLISYPSFVSNVNELHRSCRVGQTGFVHVPGKCPILGGWGLGISDRSQNKESAFQFIEWACGDEIANYLTIMAGQSPAIAVYDNNELTNLYPWLPLCREANHFAKTLTPPIARGRILASWNQIDTIMARYMYELLGGRATVEDAVACTDAALREVLKT